MSLSIRFILEGRICALAKWRLVLKGAPWAENTPLILLLSAGPHSPPHTANLSFTRYCKPSLV